MPSGGAGRHWKPTKSAGNDAPKCACGDGLTAMRTLATVPLCRRHASLCKRELGEGPSSALVREWAQRQAGAAEPAAAPEEVIEVPVPVAGTAE